MEPIRRWYTTRYSYIFVKQIHVCLLFLGLGSLLLKNLRFRDLASLVEASKGESAEWPKQGSNYIDEALQTLPLWTTESHHPMHRLALVPKLEGICALVLHITLYTQSKNLFGSHRQLGHR